MKPISSLGLFLFLITIFPASSSWADSSVQIACEKRGGHLESVRSGAGGADLSLQCVQEKVLKVDGNTMAEYQSACEGRGGSLERVVAGAGGADLDYQCVDKKVLDLNGASKELIVAKTAIAPSISSLVGNSDQRACEKRGGRLESVRTGAGGADLSFQCVQEKVLKVGGNTMAEYQKACAARGGQLESVRAGAGGADLDYQCVDKKVVDISEAAVVRTEQTAKVSGLTIKNVEAEQSEQIQRSPAIQSGSAE